MSDHAFAFLSAHTFMKVPAGPQPRPFGLAGIAWDGAVTNRPGARFGPRAIRQASHMLCDGIHPLFEVSPDALLCDHGDLATNGENVGPGARSGDGRGADSFGASQARTAPLRRRQRAKHQH